MLFQTEGAGENKIWAFEKSHLDYSVIHVLLFANNFTAKYFKWNLHTTIHFQAPSPIKQNIKITDANLCLQMPLKPQES